MSPTTTRCPASRSTRSRCALTPRLRRPYLQQVLGYSALKTGVAYLPLTLTLIGASALAARLVDRFTPKPVLVTGLLIATARFVVLTGVSGHGDYASHVLPAMLALGVGLGMAFVPITI